MINKRGTKEKQKRYLKNMFVFNSLILSLIPLIIVGLFFFFYLSNTLKKALTSRQASLVQSMQREVDLYMQAHELLLKQIIYHKEHQKIISDDILQQYLDGILVEHKYFECIRLIDEEGSITAITPFSKDYEGISFCGEICFERVVEKKEKYWSKTFISPTTGIPTIALGLPMKEGGIIGDINLKYLHELVRDIKIGRTGHVFITDGDGYLLTYHDYQAVLQKDNHRDKTPIKSGIEGKFGVFVYSDEGRKQIVTTGKISRTNWIIGISQAYSEVYKPVSNTIIIFVVVLSCSIIIIVLVIRKRSENIFKPIKDVIFNSRKIANGDYSLICPRSTYQEINILMENLEKMGRAVENREQELIDLNVKLQQSLGEKQVLISEIHHRVKNNMSVLYGLFTLQQLHTNDNRIIDLLEVSKNRIKSMSFVHKMLYKATDYSMINFSEFITSFCRELSNSMIAPAHDIKIVYNLRDIYLNIGQAVPCGIIVNEIVSNAFKHAFIGKERGIITIKLNEVDERIDLIIKDNGVGIQKKIDIDTIESFGFKLVKMLTIQLYGKIMIDNDNGTMFKLSFIKIVE